MQQPLNKLLLGFLITINFVLSLAGCQSSSSDKIPDYHFKNEKKLHSIELRATLKSNDISNVALKNGQGKIIWMAEEGSIVASGDIVVRIDMDETETRMREREITLASELDRMTTIKQSAPADIALLGKALDEKKLDFKKATHDHKWLENPRTADEIWKISSDLQIASISFSHAAMIYELRKNVTSKGFDSPFALRSSQIDRRSREVEFEYALRSVRRLNEPPLPEELARVNYLKSVASGEIWLAENELLAASLTTQIKKNNLEIVIERTKARLREESNALAGTTLKALRDGIVIHPLLWGHYKFTPGATAWEGIGIIQIISEGSYYLEALADESDANMLNEKASATIEFDGLPGQLFSGEITSISKAPRKIRSKQESAIRFFPVQISVNAKNGLLVGSKAKVTAILAEKQGVFIPRDALKKSGNSYEVLIKTTFGVTAKPAQIEEFNHDWAIWKDPPVQEGTLVYP